MRRVGLVGFGSIAEHGHLPAWHSFAGVEVAAVADLAPERLEQARALLPRAELYTSSLDLIARADVDLVDICTPPGTHMDLILAACDRGLGDIVCEKPLLLSEEEYLRVASARRRSHSRVVSVNNWIHSDLHRHVSVAIAQGAIGAVKRVELRTGRPAAALGNASWMPRWRTDLAHAGGGIILDHGWHQLYLLLRWMRQPLETVSAVTRTVDSRNHPVEDEALIDMTFTSGRGRIELSWTAGGRSNGGIISGSHGSIVIHDDCIVVRNRTGERALPFRGRLTESSYHPDWFRAMFRHDVLDERREAANRNFAEAGVLISAISAAYRSARRQGEPCRPTFGSLVGSAEAETSGTLDSHPADWSATA